MGILKNGVFGGFTGTTGALTGYELNGQYVIRARTHPRTQSSEKQLTCNQQVKVVNEFLTAVSAILKIGFGLAARNSTKNFYNLALQHNKKFAMKGVYPDIEMDFSKVMVSSGDLLPALNPVVERVPEGLKFSWDQVEVPGSDRDNDQVVLLAYAPLSKQVRMIRYGAERSAGSETIHFPDKPDQEEMETYISFINDERTAVATSIYTGRIMV